MVAIRWNAEQGWHDARLTAYEPLQLDPSAMVLHYGQAIFEGLKAYRQPDGGVAVFRPEENARRFNRSAARLAMPELPVELFLEAVDLLVDTDRAWVPTAEGQSLYLRPFMIATEAQVGMRPAHEYLFLLIAFPVTPFFPGEVKPVTVWLSDEYVRAAVGGTGEAKCAGNYAGSLLAQRQAAEKGCDQVVWLDAVERRWVEEMGGMNLFFVLQVEDGGRRLLTPALTGTLLPGVVRDSLLALAPSSACRWRRGASRSTSGASGPRTARSPRSSPAAPPRSSPRSATPRARPATGRSATAAPARSRCSCARPCSTCSTAAARTPTAGCTGSATDPGRGWSDGRAALACAPDHEGLPRGAAVLVRDVMTPAVLTVGPAHTVRQVATQMAARRVGAAVVHDPDSEGPGILTERDVLEAVAAGQDLDSELAADHLTPDAVSGSPTGTSTRPRRRWSPAASATSSSARGRRSSACCRCATSCACGAPSGRPPGPERRPSRPLVCRGS
jgi:branched-chain amino acid aminotransferase group II